MSIRQSEKDLVVLVADKNMEFALTGLLNRSEALQIRKITSKIYVHPHRDPGCLLRGHSFLQLFVNQYSYALIMLDREGCGQESVTREIIENRIEKKMVNSGWGDRSAAVVMDPELEIWVWSDSPNVKSILGWEGSPEELRNWLGNQGFWGSGQGKPFRPKEAMEKTLQYTKKKPSSSIFLELAQGVSFNRCIDPAFLKFKTTLQQWFPR